jgi:hypothetical protein
VDQLQPEIQWTFAGFLAAVCGLLLKWLYAACKWIGRKLFGDEKTEGWIPKLINKHCEMMDAMITVPESMKTLSQADEQQTVLLKQIADVQTGQSVKLDAIIDAKLCLNQAIFDCINKNEPEAQECIRKAAGYLLKAKEN